MNKKTSEYTDEGEVKTNSKKKITKTNKYTVQDCKNSDMPKITLNKDDASRAIRIFLGTATDEDIAIDEKKKAERKKKEENIKQNKKASTGLTYNEARAIIAELYQKYKGNMMESSQWVIGHDPRTGADLIGGTKYSPTTDNMSENDKKRLALANKTMTEIEQKYGITPE